MIKVGLLFHVPAKEGKNIRTRRKYKKIIALPEQFFV
jgi:hypothetical protein